MTGDQAPFLFSDGPISSSSQDRFHRRTYAHQLAKFLSGNIGSESLVMAVQGPWGSGKTSILNLIAEEIGDKAIILKFNPWLFSGTEQLVSQFFIEVSSQVLHNDQSRLKKLANLLEKYGDYFATAIGKIPHAAWFQIGFKAFRFLITQKSRQPASEIKKELEDQFRTLDKRVVILVDDLDRMRDDEVREIVRLVRLVGNFPNVTYVLAYDQGKVAKALDPDPKVGLAFLEKIVQVAYEVPKPHQQDLNTMCFEAIDACLAATYHRDLNSLEWQNLWPTVIQPLLKTPRDVRRYTISLPPILHSIGDEIALADLLAIEAIRILLPDSFKLMANMHELLTTGKQSWRGTAMDEPTKAKFEELFASAGDQRGVVREACQRLFPASQSHLGGTYFSHGRELERERERRIAAPEVFLFYLRHALMDGDISTREVEDALRSMSDRAKFHATLRALGGDRQEKLLKRIEAYEGVYPKEAIEPGTGSILDCYDQFRKETRGMFDMTGVSVAMRVVYRLYNQMDSGEERHTSIRRLLPTLKWHSAAQELIRAAKGHEFIPEDMERELLLDLYERVLRESPDKLRQESGLWWLIYAALKDRPEKKEEFLSHFKMDPLFIGLLQSALSFGHRQSGNNLFSEVVHTLPWEALQETFGEELLLAHIQALPDLATLPDLEPLAVMAVDLAKKYASGWRPDDFFRRPSAASREEESPVDE